jgi:hypothetical protein
MEEVYRGTPTIGAKSAESIALSTPGMLEATDALELVQIDHTLADVMIVDSEYRRSIGRPWLSLAVDVATRSVLMPKPQRSAPAATEHFPCRVGHRGCLSGYSPVRDF